MINVKKIRNHNNLYNEYNKYIKEYYYKYKIKYNSHEINEMSNDVFIKLCKHFDQIKEKEYPIRKWIFRVCKTTRIDYDRKSLIENNKKYVVNDEFINNIEDTSTESFEKIDFDINLKNVDKESKEILYYKHIGYKNKEISKLLNMSERSVYRKINSIKEYVKIKN